jgi:hypothetical protein
MNTIIIDKAELETIAHDWLLLDMSDKRQKQLANIMLEPRGYYKCINAKNERLSSTLNRPLILIALLKD